MGKFPTYVLPVPDKLMSWSSKETGHGTHLMHGDLVFLFKPSLVLNLGMYLMEGILFNFKFKESATNFNDNLPYITYQTKYCQQN